MLKELPVLGKDSEQVARIALAAAAQGKYFELHQRLFAESGRATKAKALRIASELGLDVGRLERDMDDPTITAALLENTRLARRSISSATGCSARATICMASSARR